jgi:hypothetical protein
MIKKLYTGCIVCRGRMDAQDAYRDVGGRQRLEQVVERRAVFKGEVK